MRLTATPLTLAAANALVSELHRHHKPTVGHRFSVGALLDGRIVGVVIVGRPVARHSDQETTAEVTRLATDGTRNACSFLYQRAARAAAAMGFHRIQTYTLPEEGGASLRAAGWRLEGETQHQPGGWNSRPMGALFPSNAHRAEHPQGTKLRWARVFPENLPRAAACGTLPMSPPPDTGE